MNFCILNYILCSSSFLFFGEPILKGLCLKLKTQTTEPEQDGGTARYKLGY